MGGDRAGGFQVAVGQRVNRLGLDTIHTAQTRKGRGFAQSNRQQNKKKQRDQGGFDPAEDWRAVHQVRDEIPRGNANEQTDDADQKPPKLPRQTVRAPCGQSRGALHRGRCGNGINIGHGGGVAGVVVTTALPLLLTLHSKIGVRGCDV